MTTKKVIESIFKTNPFEMILHTKANTITVSLDSLDNKEHMDVYVDSSRKGVFTLTNKITNEKI